MWPIFKREVGAFWTSPLAYVLCAVFPGLSGWLFLYLLRENLYTPQTLATLFALATAFWLPLPIAGATMRLFAEERQTGTLETLLTAPVGDAQVVWGKFLAAYGFVLLQLALASIPLWALRLSARHLTTFDGAGLAGAWLALAALAATGTALGTLVSLCTRHQAVAVALSLTVLTLPHLIFLAGAQALPALRRYFGGYPIEIQIFDFARGMVDFRVLALHASLSFLVLFLCIRILESRLWRK